MPFLHTVPYTLGPVVMKTVDAIAGPRVGGDPVTGIQALGLATSSAGRLCAGESFPCYACCGMMARDVVGRGGMGDTNMARNLL